MHSKEANNIIKDVAYTLEAWEEYHTYKASRQRDEDEAKKNRNIAANYRTLIIKLRSIYEMEDK